MQAFALLAPLARRGSPEAQLWVARAYLEGRAVPLSRSDAVRWCERAARAGLVEAQTLMASLRLTSPNVTVASALPAAQHPGDPGGRNEADLDSAMYWSRQAAEGGSADAKALLAYLYAAGPEAMRDPTLSETLYRESAASGSPQGALGHGLNLLRSPDETDRQQAVKWIQKAADANLAFAFYLAGLVHENGVGVKADLPAAIQFYRQAAERGIRQGQQRFGLALMQGHGVARNPLVAETWLRRAALAGEPEAALAIGTLYAVSGDLPPNYLEAARWFTLAAEAGHRRAARALAALHLQGGYGLKQDRAEAARWLCCAGRQGDQAAWSELAAIVLQGAGDENARIAVLQWHEAAARSGDLQAAFMLGMFFTLGVAVGRDETQAMFWLRRAAERIVEARYRLGRMLYQGQYLTLDYVESRAWLMLAANSGHIQAKVLLGEMLLNARGGPKDPAAALTQFLAAAEHDHIGAMFAAGTILSGGHGIPTNALQAKNLFKQAAHRGHAFAQLAFGRILHHGIAGERDLVQARDWFAKAHAQGLSEAAADLQAMDAVRCHI